MKVYQLRNELSYNADQNDNVVFVVDGKEYVLKSVSSDGNTCNVELVEVVKPVEVKTEIVKHKLLRLNDCMCLYRGKEIELRKHISTGYNGRYKVGKQSFTTQQDAKKYIDKLCSDKNIESFMTATEAKKYKQDYYN